MTTSDSHETALPFFYRVVVPLEVFVCFAPVTGLWAFGALAAPMLLVDLVMHPTQVLQTPLRSWWLMGLTAGGTFGLFALAALLSRLTARPRPIRKPNLVLSGIATGVLTLLPVALLGFPVMVIALAPIASTAH